MRNRQHATMNQPSLFNNKIAVSHSAATTCYAPPPSLARLFADAPNGAILSPDRKYRYFLWRVFDPLNRAVNFVGLNPSTADEHENDATIRRCISFARSWGFGAVFMTNLFAFRSTDPKGLQTTKNPIGEYNDEWIKMVAAESGLIVSCWGNHGGKRGQEILDRLTGRACHLGLNKDGSPKHPLYLSSNTRPTRFQQTGAQCLR